MPVVLDNTASGQRRERPAVYHDEFAGRIGVLVVGEEHRRVRDLLELAELWYGLHLIWRKGRMIFTCKKTMGSANCPSKKE